MPKGQGGKAKEDGMCAYQCYGVVMRSSHARMTVLDRALNSLNHMRSFCILGLWLMCIFESKAQT